MQGPRSITWRGKLLAITLVIALAGCSSGIYVRRTNEPSLDAAWRESMARLEGLSPRTVQTLRQLDLDNSFRRHPHDAFAFLQTRVVQEPREDSLFALAEMALLLGRRLEKDGQEEALAYYYLCAGYAYHYLFDSGLDAPAELGGVEQVAGFTGRVRQVKPEVPAHVYDPRFRLACDLYNEGLSKCLAFAQRRGQLDPRLGMRGITPRGEDGHLAVAHLGFAWKAEEFGPLQFCEDFDVVGLANHYRTYGLGVPMICERIEPPSIGVPLEREPYPPGMGFPVTAFLRFDGPLADLGSRRQGRLELINPLVAHRVAVKGHTVPLQTDLTTPLAYTLSRTNLEKAGLLAFLQPDRLRRQQGLYLVEPYQPGKIPVVLVHGLLSSPITWAPMFNDLLADPLLRERYQFWFYFYPTGNPFPVAAADLRKQLGGLRSRFDPERRDPALDNMVFVGHSMGGLISKLVTQDSGNDFWALVTPQPFPQVPLEPETRTELQPVFFFERVPEARRVIFLGTPHHGSDLSSSSPAQFVRKLIQLPRDLVKASAEIAKDTSGGLQRATGTSGKGLPTSLDLLDPGSPTLELLAHRTAPTGVLYHSIIGVAYDGKDKGDGVVSYTSAHIDGVQSELTVNAVHTEVHHHPQSVQEVRRILIEHLKSLAETR